MSCFFDIEAEVTDDASSDESEGENPFDEEVTAAEHVATEDEKQASLDAQNRDADAEATVRDVEDEVMQLHRRQEQHKWKENERRQRKPTIRHFFAPKPRTQEETAWAATLDQMRAQQRQRKRRAPTTNSSPAEKRHRCQTSPGSLPPRG